MSITCGVHGSTGQQIADAINLNTTNLAILSSLPISRIYTNAPLGNQTVGTTPAKITLGDSTQIIRPGIPITSFKEFTAPSDGYYEVQFNLSCIIDTNKVVVFKGAVDNVVIAGEGATITGLGAGHPTVVSWSSILSLTNNQKVSVYASTATGSTGMIIDSSSIYIKKI
ncbi:MAG: hypothetical protein JHC33_09065 [Ignisphaera sp.]|nr:hypothetical protein [Ignisphaera sp.]